MLVVPEIFRHGERGMANPKPAAGRLIHLAENHHHIRQNAGVFHFAVKFLALAAAFSDSAEYTDALLMADHVVDHLGEQHGLSHPRSTEEPRLAAALERHQHINYFDTRF